MTDLRVGLLHQGFTGGNARLASLVKTLELLDFCVLEDLQGSERSVPFFVCSMYFAFALILVLQVA